MSDGTGRVRVIAKSTGTFYGQPMTARDIYTVAGGGTSLADGVPATSAALAPGEASVDGSGNVVIADAGHLKIRVVAESSGTFYGQPMIAGDIGPYDKSSTVLSGGVGWLVGVGGSASLMSWATAWGVASVRTARMVTLWSSLL